MVCSFLALALRVPMAAEHRGNIHVGGTCVKAPISARDREICRMLKPRLERLRLGFAEAGFVDHCELTGAGMRTYSIHAQIMGRCIMECNTNLSGCYCVCGCVVLVGSW